MSGDVDRVVRVAGKQAAVAGRLGGSLSQPCQLAAAELNNTVVISFLRTVRMDKTP
jgi:hypothetical protein